MAVTIVEKQCPQNHTCPAVPKCPMQALTQKDYSAPEVDVEKCTDCGVCSTLCPMGAFKFVS